MKNVAQNRKARFNYTIDEEVEAGLVLLGSEVKSIRAGKVNINDAYAVLKDGDFYLLSANISEYKGSNQFNHDPLRPRKLLLHKKQMHKLAGKIDTKGFSLVPLSLYFNSRNIIKVNLGLAKGKKLHDKRAAIKEKDERRREARGEE